MKKKEFNWGNSSPFFVKSVEQEIFVENNYEKIYPVQPGDVVMDLGASVGPFTWSIMDKASKVYAFEPTKEAIEMLEENTKGFPVEIVGKALNHMTGRCTFPFWDQSTGGACGANTSEERMEEIKRGISVECTTFMDFVKEYNISNIDFIKTDSEGGEYKLFRDENIDFLVNNVRNIVGEFHLLSSDDWGKREFRYARDKYFKLFKTVQARSVDNVDITWDLYNDHFVEYYEMVYLHFSNE